LRVIGEAVEDPGVDRTRTEHVHADLASLQVDGPRSGERPDGGLAGVVDAEGREPLHARDRAVHDDRAAVDDERQRLLAREARSAHVQVEGLVEVLLRHLTDRRVLAVAGAGEEDVDATLLAPDDVVEAAQVGEVPGVALDAGDVPSDRLHRGVELLLAPPGDEHVRALFDEQLRRRERHPGRGGRDDRDLAVELSPGSLRMPLPRLEQTTVRVCRGSTLSQSWGRCRPAILAQVSLSVTVRFHTNAPGRESTGSTQK